MDRTGSCEKIRKFMFFASNIILGNRSLSLSELGEPIKRVAEPRSAKTLKYSALKHLQHHFRSHRSYFGLVCSIFAEFRLESWTRFGPKPLQNMKNYVLSQFDRSTLLQMASWSILRRLRQPTIILVIQLMSYCSKIDASSKFWARRSATVRHPKLIMECAEWWFYDASNWPWCYHPRF